MNHSTTELSDYIDGWLNTFITDSATTCFDQELDATFSPRLNWNDMPTPPSSDLPQSTPTKSGKRSPKRRRQDDTSTQQNLYQDSPFDDKQTPTGPARTNKLPPMALPTRPLTGQVPSLSSASSNRSRSTSPVKRSTLQLLNKPVYFVPLEKNPSKQLQENILKTYRRISDIVSNENFLPRAVEQDIEASYGKTRSYWYFDHADDQTSVHMQELAALREIEQAAISRQIQEASESAWNVDVHGPLLKLALAPFPSLSREILTHASISKPFVPEMRSECYYDMTQSKMIDWGITVRPSSSTSQQISKVLDGLPNNQRSINQTIYGPVRNDPIAVSIETKIAIGAIEDARCQLGLWVAAWHQRLSALRSSDEQIITLPLILVMEHEWKLMFACDQGNSIVSTPLLIT